MQGEGVLLRARVMDVSLLGYFCRMTNTARTDTVRRIFRHFTAVELARLTGTARRPGQTRDRTSRPLA